MVIGPRVPLEPKCVCPSVQLSHAKPARLWRYRASCSLALGVISGSTHRTPSAVVFPVSFTIQLLESQDSRQVTCVCHYGGTQISGPLGLAWDFGNAHLHSLMDVTGEAWFLLFRSK